MLQRTPENAIFSLRQVFVSAFLAGEKCVELRRKAPNLAVGSHIWFYSKLPIGKIVASARLQSVAILPIEQIWAEHQHCISLVREDFDHYLIGLSEATVMSFDKFSSLSQPIDLETLRRVEPGFQPPQFFRRVHEGRLLDKLSKSITQ
jgi:predicted transcriptional regulator